MEQRGVITDQGDCANPKLKPIVPPKPQMDEQKHNATKMVDGNADIDLDSLLMELCALENQLNSSAADTNPASVLSQFTSSSISNSQNRSEISDRQDYSLLGSSPIIVGQEDIPAFYSSSSKIVDDAPTFNVEISTPSKSESTTPTVATYEKLAYNDHLDISINKETITAAPSVLLNVITTTAMNRTQSPDNDSAFCDSNSLASSESIFSTHNNNNGIGSATNHWRNNEPMKMTNNSNANLTYNRDTDSKLSIDSVKTVSIENLADEEKLREKAKAEKIKMALEKMKEANIKKINMKFFFGLDSTTSKDLIIDERWSVGYVLKILAVEFRVPFSINHVLLEMCLDMHLERIYEDHELLLENVSLWTADSTNEIHFVEKASKYDLFYNPQLYLLNENKNTAYDSAAKQRLIMDYFSVPQIKLPETSGVLSLKSDGKKSWKTFYFTLRQSGLYVCTKGPKSKASKDLVCLSQLDNIQIYNSVGWKKKYKAPTEFGFALKHPKIQVKSSKYIKYLCAESEESAKFWMTALRLAKHGKRLFDNFVQCCEYLSEQEDKKLSSSSKIQPTFHGEINSSSFTVPSIKNEKFPYNGTTTPPSTVSSTPIAVNGKSGRSPSVGRPPRMPPAVPSSFGRSTLRSTLRSLDNLSNVSSSGCSLRDSESVTEVDSDEEDVTASVCDIRCVVVGDAASTSNGESFPPPPPPPLPLCLAGAADVDDTYERPRTAANNNNNDDDVSVDGSGYGDVIDTSTVRRRKVPPVPPRRSENTRLSTTLSMTSSTTSLNINQAHNFYANEQSSAANSGRFSNLSSPSSGDRTPISSDVTSNRTPIINNVVQHKPPLPTKPKFLTTISGGAINMDDREKVTPQPMGFQSELQLAMQKRLQKLNDVTEGQPS